MALYRIEELVTSGWVVYDETSTRLTREEAEMRVQDIVSEGINPNDLRLRRDE